MKKDYKVERNWFRGMTILFFILCMLSLVLFLIEKDDYDELYHSYSYCNDRLDERTKELSSIKKELCDVGFDDFCNPYASSLKMYPCNDEGIKVCKPFHSGEVCFTYICKEGTEAYPTYTIYNLPGK